MDRWFYVTGELFVLAKDQDEALSILKEKLSDLSGFDEGDWKFSEMEMVDDSQP